jgi:glutamate 5-kinase
MNGPDTSTQDALEARRNALAGARRVVVKIGTNVLTRSTGEIAIGRIHTLIEEIVDLHRQGLEAILVSSGAISLGMDQLGLREKPTSLPDKQACAAVGQIRLMGVYEQAFQRFGITVAQILLTEDDFANRVRYLNLRNTMNRLLEQRVIPIVNENDSVSTSEIETKATSGAADRKTVFGDNDQLSALVMSKLGADLLILLSDVDGLLPYTSETPDLAKATLEPLRLVTRITPEIEAMAREGNVRGRGGMLGKLRSIRVALDAGGAAVIANGTRNGIIADVFSGLEVGTVFVSRRKISSRKRWLAYATAPVARVVVNQGARDALIDGRSSLLFAGVLAVEGTCTRGDVVSVVDEQGVEFARGIANYSREDAIPLLGKRTDAIAKGESKDYPELVTRDNLVILDA